MHGPGRILAASAVLAALQIVAPLARADEAVQLGAAPVLSGRQARCGAAEGQAEILRQRAVQAHQLFHRPSRRGHAIPRAHRGILSRRRAHGRGHPRMRRDLHQGQGTRLPAFAMRPAHDDEHPRHPRSRREMHATLHAGRSGGEEGGKRQMLHQRPDARRVQAAERQDGRLRQERRQRPKPIWAARQAGAPISMSARAAR